MDTQMFIRDAHHSATPADPCAAHPPLRSATAAAAARLQRADGCGGGPGGGRRGGRRKVGADGRAGVLRLPADQSTATSRTRPSSSTPPAPSSPHRAHGPGVQNSRRKVWGELLGG
ncbi:uncharacterized protein LOC125524055 [Triticum urartu]|uniref:uncharacterized protein LOC125524055 n=1 Tax=Triticum urartu TaxID=4572 RepID=UPI00204478F5|nr:uncharacterized protein LOC125524055 [Triticum urartu]